MVDLKEAFKQFSTIDLKLMNQALHDQIVWNRTKDLADFERTQILHDISLEELMTRTDR